jgi:hypothetical protein
MTRSFYEKWHGEKLPRHIAYLYHNEGYSWFDVKPRWQVMTYKEIFKKKTDRILNDVYNKRRYATIRPGYIWVFNNDSFLFSGWYLYIKTLKDDYALNFRQNRDELLRKVMPLYPCGVIPMKENFDIWAKAFSRIYPHKGFKRTKNQGLLKCRCIIDKYGKLEDIVPYRPQAYGCN